MGGADGGAASLISATRKLLGNDLERQGLRKAARTLRWRAPVRPPRPLQSEADRSNWVADEPAISAALPRGDEVALPSCGHHVRSHVACDKPHFQWGLLYS